MRLIILFGGRSAEHDVSCVTAAHVLAAVDPDRYEVVPVGIAEDGQWVMADAPPGASALVAEGPGVDPSILTPDSMAFPLVHGPLGEDGTIQGLLELAGIPYIGSGVLASALCMDKAMSKDVLGGAGIDQVRYLALRDIEVDDGALDEAAAELGFPLFVKPANLGSSVAVTKANDVGELSSAVKLALAYDEWIVLEEAVTAREVGCGLLGYGRLRASVPGEVRPSREFYDYEDKYIGGAAQLLVPAPLPAEVVAETQGLAKAAGHALRVDGMALVDFFYEEGGRGMLVNSVTTIPGFTPTSFFFMVWEATVINTSNLVEHLVDAALERHHARADRVDDSYRPSGSRHGVVDGLEPR
ncbi:MAG: D-alanine--D-alanine ligase [Actinomycetota bacterium]|nr:D-alanine--D-alanine ligase [Actinomycetota bacterium]